MMTTQLLGHLGGVDAFSGTSLFQSLSTAAAIIKSVLTENSRGAEIACNDTADGLFWVQVQYIFVMVQHIFGFKGVMLEDDPFATQN